MRRSLGWTLIVVLFGVAGLPARGADDGDLKILTYPIGLVTGAHPVETDLGPGGEQLDDRPAVRRSLGDEREAHVVGERELRHALHRMRVLQVSQ